MPRPSRVNQKMVKKAVYKGFKTSDELLTEALKVLRSVASLQGQLTEEICQHCEKHRLVTGQEMCCYCAGDLARMILADLPLIRGTPDGKA